MQVAAIEGEEEDNDSSDVSSASDTTPDEVKLMVPLPSGATITARRKSSVDSRKLLTANEEFNTGGERAFTRGFLRV